jgi:hypothetical protein
MRGAKPTYNTLRDRCRWWWGIQLAEAASRRVPSAVSLTLLVEALRRRPPPCASRPSVHKVLLVHAIGFTGPSIPLT